MLADMTCKMWKRVVCRNESFSGQKSLACSVFKIRKRNKNERERKSSGLKLQGLAYQGVTSYFFLPFPALLDWHTT